MSLLLLFNQSGGGPIIIPPSRGGFRKRKQKNYDDEIAARELRHAQIVQAYERLVENKSPIVAEIAEQFATPTAQRIDYDKLLADVDAVERVWRAYLDADDEDILLLI